jgi:hypothetical protein
MKRTKTKKIWVAIMIAALIAGVGGCYYPYRHYDYDYHRLDDRYYGHRDYGHRDYDHDRW